MFALIWPFRRKPHPAPPPAWRILKDPHAARFYVQRREAHYVAYVGSVHGYATRHTSKTERAARNWMLREIKRPIILASFDANGEPHKDTDA